MQGGSPGKKCEGVGEKNKICGGGGSVKKIKYVGGGSVKKKKYVGGVGEKIKISEGGPRNFPFRPPLRILNGIALTWCSQSCEICFLSS